VVEGARHHFFVSSCHRYDSQQWYLSISHHHRFDQGAIHVQRIYSPGYGYCSRIDTTSNTYWYCPKVIMHPRRESSKH
jgi:hypothetical protein